jgi:hypothetical protein
VFAEGPPDTTEAAASVDPNPIGVVAVWTPGMTFTSCRTVTTTGNAEMAAALANAVNAAAPMPADWETRMCAVGWNAGVELYFEYPGAAHSGQLINVGLTGCSYLNAPNRWARETYPVWSELSAIAPFSLPPPIASN